MLHTAHERGAWPSSLTPAAGGDKDGSPDDAPATALTMVALVGGMLGAQPDAARGRLRLRPQPPEDWARLEVRALRVGEARVSLRYERSGERHVLRVAQQSGGAPLGLVLEPVLAGARLAAATVDGRPAELAARRFGERLLVPVQIVLDHERTVELRITEGER